VINAKRCPLSGVFYILFNAMLILSPFVALALRRKLFEKSIYTSIIQMITSLCDIITGIKESDKNKKNASGCVEYINSLLYRKQAQNIIEDILADGNKKERSVEDVIKI
jgi:hypothetical protein